MSFILKRSFFRLLDHVVMVVEAFAKLFGAAGTALCRVQNRAGCLDMGGPDASPAAYMWSFTKDFAMIHFVLHHPVCCIPFSTPMPRYAYEN